MINTKSENTTYLSNRLNFNEKYSNSDFHKWLFGHLETVPYNSVLDVGCGTGKQSFYFANRNNDAQICSFDVSETSIASIVEKVNNDNINNIEAVVGNIDDVSNSVKQFRINEFDLVHSSFALYYSSNGMESLRQMISHLKDTGSLVISAPNSINTFLNFLSKYQEIPQLSWDCLEFIDDIVLGFCHSNFNDIRTHLFVNNLLVTSADDLIENYRSSTFYNKNAENKIFKDIQEIIKNAGHFHIQKNSKIVIASNRV